MRLSGGSDPVTMPAPSPAPVPDGRGAEAACVAPSLTILTARADFLRAAQAGRASAPAFMLQARQRPAGEGAGMRVGFTCSKKVGNAVARNRAKRRLREIARAVLPARGRDGWDYVLIGKAGATATHPYAALLTDLEAALARVHRARKP